jgi:signal peptide peptidase SppA
MLTMHHLTGRPWAVTAEVALAVRRIARETRHFSALRQVAELHADLQAGPRPAGSRSGAVALIPLIGLMTQRGGSDVSVEYTSTDLFASMVRGAAADESVGSIVLEIATPGGEVYGVTEAAAVIRDARAVKPVVAVANSHAGSAGYWLAAQATELWVTPSGEVGSVGVYGMHVDESKALEAEGLTVTLISAGKFKVEGNPFEKLGDEAHSAMQADVNRYYGLFVADVAKGRRVSLDAVRGGFGEGRMVGAKAAVEQGMADQVGTLQEAIRRAATLATEKRRAASAPAVAQALRLRRERA